MWNDRVADWMSTPPITVAPNTSLTAARRLMERYQVRRLPVVEDGRLIGIVTWGDLRAAQPSAAAILSVYEWHALLDKATIAECMTRHPLTVSPDASLREAAEIMLTHKIGGLPVVEAGRVVGIITESDLMRQLIATASGIGSVAPDRVTVRCYHCNAILRRRSFDTIGPDDQCWRCHYHLHRCENCRSFDGIMCMLDRPDRHTPIPGQRCTAFSYRQPRAVNETPDRP
jgi:CBS domain-containing protein